MPSIIFANRSILNVWEGSKYTSVGDFELVIAIC